MMVLDTRALKEKAEKATPGRRSVCLDRFNSDEEWVFLVDSPEHDDFIVMVSTGEFDDALASANAQARADAEFIAAFNPQTALALLAERDTAHARIAALEQFYSEIETQLNEAYEESGGIPCDDTLRIGGMRWALVKVFGILGLPVPDWPTPELGARSQ